MSEENYVRELNRLEEEYYNSLPNENYVWWFKIALIVHWYYSLLGWFFPMYYFGDVPPYYYSKPTLGWITLILYAINTILLFKTENFWLSEVLPERWWRR